ncbi:MAG: hypothetical protein NTZ83_01860, partial [Candidatus Pacearchaeota archaeon]|nr:hypothetical protein [Candidatus Pacearchaeota archaeon]
MEELQKIYKEKLVPNYDAGNYVEVDKLLNENPFLDNYLTITQLKILIRYVLEPNISDMKGIKLMIKRG